MADALAEIDQVAEQADADLAAAADSAALEAFRVKYLGTKGRIRGLTKLIGKAAPADRPGFGQRVNALHERIDAAFAARQAESGGAKSIGPMVDVTEPGIVPAVAPRHILMRVVDELTDLFARMGFATAGGPEVEDEFHNFVALNIPESHPARDPLDNFYLQGAAGSSNSSAKGQAPGGSVGSAGLRLLRTQTSTVQIRVMESQPPPIRVVIPGRVYRPDTTDSTHLPMFHQLEALVVDTDVTMVDLKSTVLQFARAYFGPETKVRFRPSFFPFTEPSGEVDVWFEDRNKWIELGGMGMVHPNVFRAVGIDPEKYSGWAFGFGIERIAMRKYGIGDIRHFVENDIRFLRQF
jgi:phenylalanyl-tRNA synthetase alpha chain